MAGEIVQTIEHVTYAIWVVSFIYTYINGIYVYVCANNVANRIRACVCVCEQNMDQKQQQKVGALQLWQWNALNIHKFASVDTCVSVCVSVCVY